MMQRKLTTAQAAAEFGVTQSQAVVTIIMPAWPLVPSPQC